MDQMLIHTFAAVYGVAFILIGVEHFKEPQKFVEIVPPYFPFALFLVYLTGEIEISG